MQIIQYLGPMLGQQARNSLYFNDDLVVADEIRNIFLLQLGTPIREFKPLLLDKRNPPVGKLQGQALLVHGFQKPRPHGRVYIKARPDYLIALISIQQHRNRQLKDFIAN
jgi:hypothetical protein